MFAASDVVHVYLPRGARSADWEIEKPVHFINRRMTAIDRAIGNILGSAIVSGFRQTIYAVRVA